MSSTNQGFQITRGFEFDFASSGSGNTAIDAARAQLQEARAALEASLAAVLEACPAALDAAFTNDVAGMVLKYRRRAQGRAGQGDG